MKADEKMCRDIVRGRSKGLCERCGRSAESMHHRKNRSQGGRWEPSNIVHLCGDGTRGCHGVLTNTNGKRQEHEATGWIVPSYLAPAAAPLRHVVLGAVFLDDDGSWRPASSAEFEDLLKAWGEAQSGPFGGAA